MKLTYVRMAKDHSMLVPNSLKFCCSELANFYTLERERAIKVSGSPGSEGLVLLTPSTDEQMRVTGIAAYTIAYCLFCGEKVTVEFFDGK